MKRILVSLLLLIFIAGPLAALDYNLGNGGTGGGGITSVQPSDLDAVDSPSDGEIPSKTAGGDTWTWIPASGTGDMLLATTQTATAGKTWNSWNVWNGTGTFNAFHLFASSAQFNLAPMLKEITAPVAISGFGLPYVSSVDSDLHFVDDSGVDTNLLDHAISAGNLPSDGYASTYVNASGDTMTGNLGIGVSPSYLLHLQKSGDSVSGGSVGRIFNGIYQGLNPGSNEVYFAGYINAISTGTTDNTGNAAHFGGGVVRSSDTFNGGTDMIVLEGRADSRSHVAGHEAMGLFGFVDFVSTGTAPGANDVRSAVRARACASTDADCGTDTSVGTLYGLHVENIQGGNSNSRAIYQAGTDDFVTLLASHTHFGSDTPHLAKVAITQAGGADVKPALSLRSGGASDYVYATFGRTSIDFSLAVAGASDQFATGSIAGDAVWSAQSTSNSIMFQSGVNSVPELTVDNNAVGISSTVPVAALGVTGGIIASSTITAQGGFHGDGANVTNLNAANLSSGIIPDARMPDLTGDVTTSEGAVATTIADNSVDGTDIALGSDAQGDIMYYDGTNWVRLAAGTDGNFLETNGAGQNPSWTNTGSLTQTLTNKTLDVEGTGNSVTTVEKVWLPAAGCNNATASTIWDLPTSNAPAAGCRTGTNMQKGVLDFDQSTDESAFNNIALPADWTGNVDARFFWEANDTGTNSVVWGIQTACVADNETDDPSLNTASTVTDANGGTTAHKVMIASVTGITTTGCAAGEFMHIKVYRDADNGSDTLAADARLIGVELTLRRAQ